MTSGIYRLTFKTGETYVGKSVDVAQRWKQHFDKLSKGSAAKNMMAAFYASDSRYPKTELLLECHPDVLDEYENYFINSLEPELNTQRPEPRTQVEQEALVRHANEGRAVYSTPIIMLTLENIHKDKFRLIEEVEELEAKIEEIEGEYEELSAAWDDRAMQELWKDGKFKEVRAALGNVMEELSGLRSEYEKLVQFRVRVEGLGWFGRLFKRW